MDHVCICGLGYYTASALRNHQKTCATHLRYTKQSADSGDFVTSAVVGAVTGSALLGGLIGGDIVGGVVGDLLDGDLFD